MEKRLEKAYFNRRCFQIYYYVLYNERKLSYDKDGSDLLGQCWFREQKIYLAYFKNTEKCLKTIVHEALHASCPAASEEHVRNVAMYFSHILWDMGLRLDTSPSAYYSLDVEDYKILEREKIDELLWDCGWHGYKRNRDYDGVAMIRYLWMMGYFFLSKNVRQPYFARY